MVCGGVPSVLSHAAVISVPSPPSSCTVIVSVLCLLYITNSVKTQTIGAENTSLSREPPMDFPYFIAGTAFPCSSLDKCTFVINGSEPIGQHIDPQAEEEIEKTPPCVIQGHLDINHNWYGYLAIVKLHPGMGKFYYEFTYSQRKCCIKILLYLSEQVDTLKAHMSCIQKQSAVDPLSPQVISLSPSTPASGCIHNNTADGGIIECRSGRILRSDIEREWYIAAASCGSPTGLDVHYSLKIFGLIGECPQSPSVNRAAGIMQYSTVNIPSILYCLLLSIIITTAAAVDT